MQQAFDVILLKYRYDSLLNTMSDVSVDVEKVWCIYVKTLEVSEANKLPSLSTWEARRLPLIPHIPHFNFHSKCISLIIKAYLSILRNSFGLLLGMPSGSAIICCTWAFVWVHLLKRQFSSCVFLREIHEMCITGWFSLSGLPCSVLKIRNTIRDEKKVCALAA